MRIEDSRQRNAISLLHQLSIKVRQGDDDCLTLLEAVEGNVLYKGVPISALRKLEQLRLAVFKGNIDAIELLHSSEVENILKPDVV